MTGIEFDQSDANMVLVCHDCLGTWRAFAWDDGRRRAARRCTRGTLSRHPDGAGPGDGATHQTAESSRYGVNVPWWGVW